MANLASANRTNLVWDWMSRIPLWLGILLLAAVGISISVLSSESSRENFSFLSQGIVLTLQISVLSYAIAMVIGFLAGLGRVSTNPILHAIATLYVEVLRGIPVLVVILYVAFVLGPTIGISSNFWRAVIALALSYGAYLAEIYRSGIEAIPQGQREASRALGLSGFQTTSLIVMPQAFRIILPPLGNDFIALLKDSSLASVIGLSELTQQTRFYVSRTFDTFGGWTMAAILYLSLTLVLSLCVRLLERISKVKER
jgi:polar amino acid transport system permease protein